ncbi:hypothetical protein AVEN_30830-1 [Araneus ventricosus]|uniref:Uncharacterized protein n=1 Tax=Araneus ventricosus TaxID=182803 RepID=A0A4Y2KNK0_ARAVE|nr:hypothetical protein AVEN_30830-1 [Araneus ventricosus]
MFVSGDSKPRVKRKRGVELLTMSDNTGVDERKPKYSTVKNCFAAIVHDKRGHPRLWHFSDQAHRHQTEVDVTSDNGNKMYDVKELLLSPRKDDGENLVSGIVMFVPCGSKAGVKRKRGVELLTVGIR